MITCGARAGVSVKNLTFLPWMIFSCSGDKLAQKMSSYVESQDCVEVYNVVWSMMVCSGIFCYRACLYNIFWRMLQGGINWIP